MKPDPLSAIERRDFLKLAGAVSAVSLSRGALAQSGRGFSIVIDAQDPIASSQPVRWAAEQLQKALAAKGAKCEIVQSPEQAGGAAFHVLVAGPGSSLTKSFPQAAAELSTPESLEAGKEYAFKFETANSVFFGGVPFAGLLEDPGQLSAREAAAPKESRAKTRTVYWPAGNRGRISGRVSNWPASQSVTADDRIDKIPLMIKAGSIVPMGPFLQYSTEKPRDFLSELRIYAGANGDFTLYEDENDNYDYEKGVYATIGFHWDDAKRRLTRHPAREKEPFRAC